MPERHDPTAAALVFEDVTTEPVTLSDGYSVIVVNSAFPTSMPTRHAVPSDSEPEHMIGVAIGGALGGFVLIGLVAAYLYNGRDKGSAWVPNKAASPRLDSSDRDEEDKLDATAIQLTSTAVNPLHSDGASAVPRANAS